jgi:xylulokinase
MEGVTFSLRDVLELITQSGLNPSIIHSSGGGSSSPIWRQIQADIFKKEVTTQNNSEDAGALGAGIIAGVAVGLWPSVEKAVSLIKTRTINQPIDENAVKYERIYELYKKLYPALKQTFKGLYLISQ